MTTQPALLHTLTPALARRVRLLVLDVDGVLTDGRIYLGALRDQSVELKAFHVHDGQGILRLREKNIETVFITHRRSRALRERAAELGVGECHQCPGVRKVEVVDRILAERRLSWQHVAAVGDDYPDLEMMEAAGLSITVPNAAACALAAAHYVTEKAGGQGAVREISDLILARSVG